jgi:hypothetical protein
MLSTNREAQLGTDNRAILRITDALVIRAKKRFM